MHDLMLRVSGIKAAASTRRKQTVSPLDFPKDSELECGQALALQGVVGETT